VTADRGGRAIAVAVRTPARGTAAALTQDHGIADRTLGRGTVAARTPGRGIAGDRIRGRGEVTMAGMGLLFLCAGGVCLLIGTVLFLSQIGQKAHLSSDGPLRSLPQRRGGLQQTAKQIRVERAEALPAIETPSGVQTMASGIRSNSLRGDFQGAQLGQTLTVNHPQRGAMMITGKIIGSIRYNELWQRVKSPTEPWAPTGNTYTAHWLGNFMLYEWKDRLFLLDEYEALTDKDIATHFAPYAKRFGESNETADVYFAFPPASWKMTDIGKFNVASAVGTGLRLNPNAIGRFIHAMGDGGRALVVEDYQSGAGGQDTAWIGYEIKWEDVQAVG